MKERLIDFENHIKEELHDPEFLEEYLNEALKEEDPRVLLIALKYIAQSRAGGIAGFAKKAGYSRQTIYKTLSAKGNPTFKSLNTFLDAAGYRLKIIKIKKKEKTQSTKTQSTKTRLTKTRSTKRPVLSHW